MNTFGNSQLLTVSPNSTTSGTGEGTSNYLDLENKPSINNISLEGNKTLDELGIQEKVDGKGLSTNDYTNAEKTKLSGIQEGANNYVHPSKHPASVITQDANNRFVTDTEKSSWNNKADTSVVDTKISTHNTSDASHNDIRTSMNKLIKTISASSTDNTLNVTLQDGTTSNVVIKTALAFSKSEW